MDFRVLNFDEGVFSPNTRFSLPQSKELTISVNIRPLFRYTLYSDVVVCQLTLQYFYEQTELLTYGFAVASAINGWREFIKSDPQKEEIIKRIFDVWNASVNLGRGVLIEKIKETEFKHFFIPDIPLNRLVSILRLEQVGENND